MGSQYLKNSFLKKFFLSLSGKDGGGPKTWGAITSLHSICKYVGETAHMSKFYFSICRLSMYEETDCHRKCPRKIMLQLQEIKKN